MHSIFAPTLPFWVVLEREEKLQIHSKMLNGVVFIGTPTEGGFYADGTGFFVYVEHDGLTFTYIVACSHVVNKKTVWIRINQEDGTPRIVETHLEWIIHPNKHVDVCIYPFDHNKWNSDNKLVIFMMNVSSLKTIEQLESEVGLSLGDELFIVGAFVGKIGEQKNIPIIRIANVAAMPDEPLWGGSHRRPVFLIETRSLGGISGSPVFLHTEPSRRPQKPSLGYSSEQDATIAPYYFIGIMQGMHSGRYQGDFIADGDVEKIVPKDADFNAGIGVVIPTSQILEVINRNDLKTVRAATIEAKKKQAGHRDAAVSISKDAPSTDS
jgi:hypothetical protein